MTTAQMIICLVLVVLFPFASVFFLEEYDARKEDEVITRIRDAYYRGYADGKRDMMKGEK